MKDVTLFIIIISILSVYYLYWDSPSSQSYDTSGYTGTEALNYIREKYSSELSQARSFCTGQFKGSWIDNSNTIGCYNMQGFSSSFCSMDIIKNLESMCNSIGGSSVCSSTQASCSV